MEKFKNATTRDIQQMIQMEESEGIDVDEADDENELDDDNE